MYQWIMFKCKYLLIVNLFNIPLAKNMCLDILLFIIYKQGLIK